ncbi:ornithine cyclodeaminase family protein [Candidatus Dojkabacteria bacterium]|nr:ornithine cyclodeaminase family protein [Candidatus Dojkabacteria bacterium]
MALKIIDRKKTLSLMDFPGLINSASLAFRSFSEGKSSPPAYINIPLGDNFIHFKAGYRKNSKYFVMKYSGGFWGNAEKGLPVDYGYVIVHLSKTGEPIFMFYDLGAITDYRTAAAGALTCKLLSIKDSKVVGVIGSGIQARLQIKALLNVRPNIQIVKIWGRTPAHVTRYISEMSKKFDKINFIKCNKPKDAVVDVDILLTVSASNSPIVKAEWVSKGTHITAVGACTPTMQEHYPSVLKITDKLYADSIEKCSQDGEIHHALETGEITKKKITGEIGQLILKKIPARESNNEITFVDLVGLGIQDAAAAEYLLGKLIKK